MITIDDLKIFAAKQKLNFIIAADAETRVHTQRNGSIISHVPAGGVAVALDPIAQATVGTFVARGKTEADRRVVDATGKIKVGGKEGSYMLKRVFLKDSIFDGYYNGFSNQTLWPMCHVAFEPPTFKSSWYEDYKQVNQQFARAIKEEIKGKTFIWINDYQLALVPKYLEKPKNCVVAMFWHIPWPTWEIFRILPQKNEILESMLNCDFLAFHRGYQARNFLETVRREFEVRVDEETSKIYFNKRTITVGNLPMGIDTDVIQSMVEKKSEPSFLGNIVRNIISQDEEVKDENPLDPFFNNNRVILGIDRLDYTKGLRLRLQAIDAFLDKNPQYIGKVSYLGIIAPSREHIPSYKDLKKKIKLLAQDVNVKYAKNGWIPIHLMYHVFGREDVINFYQRANLCLVTPLDDGMNLVSKEFIIAASSSKNAGMLVLSQFAGSAIDLTQALIVNPYDVDEVAAAIKRGLEMRAAEKVKRLKSMAETLEEKNIYSWAQDFIRAAVGAAR